TPSFVVTPDRQTWHCFGACSTGGDIFSFVMKRDGIEFGEALRMLADRAGVALGDRPDPERDERRERLLAANEAAAGYFHHVLLSAAAAEGTRAYLSSRGLDAATIEAFQLGFSLDSWDALRSHLAERGFGAEELLASGLLVESERGGYDRFRGRLMFPIRDGQGRVAGFGGRELEGAQTGGRLPEGDPSGAKYINTPQTAVFDKSALLYGLDRAKEAIRREHSAIVVEGYMDAIAAHQHGIANVVASMGTALTERQIRALERFKCNILLALDADAAGIEATLRALREAEAAGVIRAATETAHPSALADSDFAEKVQQWSRDALKRATVNFHVVPLSGKDPDEMIRADRGSWDAAVANATPFPDHVFGLVAGRKDLTQPAQRAELIKELVPVVRLIEEPAHRAHYVQRLARLAQVREDVIESELRRHPSFPGRTRRTAPAPVASAGYREPREEYCLALLLRHAELRPEGMELHGDIFLLAEHRAIFEAWRTTPDIDAIRSQLSADLQPHLEPIIHKDLPVFEGSRLHEAFADCVRRIELRRLSQAKQVSAAALTDPDVQAFMGPALEEAIAL
ncbi:MAG: DNA primase, partial [Dehalococcoidia bacterium]|nr:DNA primase [Dehalococcoidia bacterium]